MKILKTIILSCMIFIINISIAFATHDINYNDLFPDTRIIEQKSIHFSNLTNEEYVLTGEYIPPNSTLSSKRMVSVISYDEQQKKWLKLYYESNNYWHPKIGIYNLLRNKLQQIIISDIQGSGRFLSYKVLGYNNNTTQILLENTGIYQGNYRVENSQLIESMGHQDTIYQWNGFFLKQNYHSKS